MEIVHQLQLEPGMSISSLLRGMRNCGFGARRLSEAMSIYEEMLSRDCTRFLTISGAMVPAGGLPLDPSTAHAVITAGVPAV